MLAYELAPHGLALRLDAQSALLGGGHPQIADKALAYYEYRYRQRDIVGDRAVIYAAEKSHVLLDDRENQRTCR